MKLLLMIFLLALSSAWAESQPEEGLLITVRALKDGGLDVRTITAISKLYAESADFFEYTRELRKLKLGEEVSTKVEAAYLVGHEPEPGSDLDRFLRKLGTRTSTPTPSKWTWVENGTYAGLYDYNGFHYKVYTDSSLSIAVSEPTSGIGKWTSFNILFSNAKVPRVDLDPKQVSCLCVDKKGKTSALKYFKVPDQWLAKSNLNHTFLAHTVFEGENRMGTIAFTGKCKRYLVRWEFGGKTLEFPF